MAAKVMTAEPIVRIVVATSWAVYAAVLIIAIPVPAEAVVEFLLEVTSALAGIIATTAAVINVRRWRILAHVAAWVFLSGYAVRFVHWSTIAAQSSETSLLAGFATVTKDAWRITQQFYDNSGIIGAAPLVFSLIVMPLLQVAIVWALFASPNQSLSRTRGTAPRAG